MIEAPCSRVRSTAGEKGPCMSDRTLLCIGLGGTAIAALCCFTPLLVIVLSALGLVSVIGWLDIVLIPMLGVFLLIAGYALWKMRRPASN